MSNLRNTETENATVTITKTITKDRLIEILSEYVGEYGDAHEVIGMMAERLTAYDLLVVAEECVGTEHMFGGDE